MRIQSLSTTSQVKAGNTAGYAVWVWSAKAGSRSVTVSAQVTAARALGSPKFVACPTPGSSTCKIGNLPQGQLDEVTVGVPVGRLATAGEHVDLTAKASARGSRSMSAAATDVVVASSSPTPTTSPISLPPVGPVGIPPLSGIGVAPQNPVSLFPTIGPTPTPDPTSLGLPTVTPRKATVHAADASATVPLDARLIGAQVAGLAVLAGAVAMAIARLSLRTPKTQSDGGTKGQRSSEGKDSS